MEFSSITVDNDVIKVWMLDGIIHCEYKPNLHIDMNVAQLTVASSKKVSNGRDNLVLADIRNLKNVDDDAREYLASEEACRHITALAVIQDTPIQHLLANWYLKIDKPKMPTKLFTPNQMDKAVRWLDLYQAHRLN